MGYFNREEQNNFKADFGFSAPHRTKALCSNPVFADHHLHRIAMMKVEHFGSKGDRDEGGLPGWVAIGTCTGCGRTFKSLQGFYADEKRLTNT